MDNAGNFLEVPVIIQIASNENHVVTFKFILPGFIVKGPTYIESVDIVASSFIECLVWTDLSQ